MKTRKLLPYLIYSVLIVILASCGSSKNAHQTPSGTTSRYTGKEDATEQIATRETDSKATDLIEKDLAQKEENVGPMLWNTEERYPKREARAVWLTTLSGLDWPKTKATSEAGRTKQKAELCALLDQLKACGINQIILQTRVRGSVIYPSSIEPWDVALTGQFDKSPGYDPLAFAIEETHKRGMELHAWVVTIPAFKIEQARRVGKKSLLNTHPSLLKRHNDQYYMDPGIPETADYLVSICREITSRYDIDGIHFDYIRYPENANSFTDGATYRKYGKGESKANWRRNNITNIVRRIYKEVKSLKPWVRVSSSPVGKYRDTRRYSSKGWNCYDAVYQDAQGWLREGIQDALYPMMYFTGDHFYPFAVDWKEGSYERAVVPGLGIYFLHPKEKNWDFSVIGRELHYLRQEQLGGQAFFRCKFLTDNTKGIYDYLENTFYAHPALTPAMPWVDETLPSKPQNPRLTNQNGYTEVLEWVASSDEKPGGGLRYNIYASKEWPVDVTKAENLVAVGLTECRYEISMMARRLYGLNLAITAIDRCGNESEPAMIGGPKQESKPLQKWSIR